MPRLRRCLLLLIALLVVAPTAWSQELPVIRPGRTKAPTVKAAAKAEDTAAKSDDEEHWQVILIGGERVGYVRTRTEALPAEGDQPQRTRTKVETKMKLKRFGQELSLGVDLITTETPEGDLLSYEFEMGTSPTGVTKSVGTIKGKNLKIDTTIAGVTASRTVAWDDSVKSPAYQERLLRESPLKPGDSKSFRMFVPELNTVTDIKITADQVREVELPNGTKRKLLKARITQSVLPTMPMMAYLDDSGEIVLGESDMFGQKMSYYEVSKEEALQKIAGAELDLAVNTLIPVTPIERPHETKRVVYRIHTPGEDAKSLFVEGDTQHVKVIDRETVEVTVTSKPIPKTGGRVQADAEYTRATQLLQSNDAKIKEHLNKAVSLDRNEGEAALALEKYVHDKLDKKNFSTAFASAAEVANNLEGDCSEHAVLLAALLRARGIPSRVAVGIVYVPGQAKMGGHMWTEAKFADGWVPLDATLGRGGIGAAHLKVAESSLADDAPLPVLTFAPLLSLGAETQIDVLKVEYR
jgi:hypothetical protein